MISRHRSRSTLFEKIGGVDTCRHISRAFYARVDRDPLLRPLFPGTSLRCAIDAFSAFLVQFLGGPAEDLQYRQWLSLRESHARFRLEPGHKKAWLRAMKGALEEVNLDPPSRKALYSFFDAASDYLTTGQSVARKVHGEIAKRWSAQRNLDDAVEAIRQSDAQRAIELSEGAGGAVLAGLLSLMMASGSRDLLRHVADRVRTEPQLVHERYAGRTLLHAAAGVGNLQMVRLFLRLGADPNELDGGKHTPLYTTGNECASNESADVVRALVGAGADVDAHDGVTAATPLHMAARRGNAVVAQALLECGADIHARDRRGDTPLQRALNCKKSHVAKLLRDYERGMVRR